MDSPDDPTVAAAGETERNARRRTVDVRCWGTRGSIPSPGPATAGFGGNTPCLAVRTGGRHFIFDAGTGIRLLGDRLAAEDGAVRARIFLSHFHWDHIQGFPFFAPLYDPEAELHITGPLQDDLDVQTLFAGQMGSVYFPVPFEAISAGLSFSHMNEDVREDGAVRISSMRVRHPSYTVGYRLDAPGGSVCYVPDNELGGGDYPTEPEWRDRLLDFVGGADVLFHDAMFTQEEYAGHVGWGHSTYAQTLDLAAEAGVDRLFFFHHAPERTDAELNPILERFRSLVADRGLDLTVNAAFEGQKVRIES